MSNKSGTSPQVISLPTGGGALHGMGETFSPDLFTGTGNGAVPIALPAGRNGFQPQLSLAYSTGNGNGPFGLGWSVSPPAISRKTDKGIPQYAGDDTFVLSGAEDLVPVPEMQPGVSRFRPRTEGLFARVERVGADGTADTTWTVRDRDGSVNRFGTPGPGGQRRVVADPTDPRRVFRWHLGETTDPFGNLIQYDYRRDTGSAGRRRWGQLYLERIRYVDHQQQGITNFLVSVTFVYEERPDPFADHRAGFEIRTRLRCRRIEVLTHADRERLTRSYELEYLDDLVRRGEQPSSLLPRNGVSLLSRVRVVGHDGERTQELPALDLGYTRFDPERRRLQPLDAVNQAMPQTSLADGDLETVDLFGNGLPDIIQLNGSVQLWRNLGGGRFDAPRPMDEVPAGVRLSDPGVQLADMNGDGRTDLLVQAQSGYFPAGFEGLWTSRGFVRYPQAPNVDFGRDDLRLVDLDGDGVTDALRTGSRFELFFNDPREGWNRVETRPRGPMEEFPDVTFTDPRVKLADLTGDGLQDIVFVDQGRIDYWPYLGHGRWAPRVTMSASPLFRDSPPLPTGFDPRRVLFGDLDGDGLDDVVYVQSGRITFWINQGGEHWSEPVTVERTPTIDDIDGVRLVDMLGTGMSGVLWTSDPVPGGGPHYQFLDLTGGVKPYLLERIDNHMGAVTTISYTSSTTFYLDDAKRSATRWRTPLPFPVQVVDRVEIADQFSQGTLTSRYRYRHGYWDGGEREFRGFGLVEQQDTERFDQAAAADDPRVSPPVVTRTWFHQGPVGEEFDDWREPDRSAEFWADDRPALGHVEALNAALAALPDRRARRDALRSLAGRVLRTEVYGRDGTSLQARPYTVSELALGIREESPPTPAEDGRHRIFFPHIRAERVSQWERGVEPMTGVDLTDDYDPFGQPRRQVSLAVPRGRNYRRAAQPGEPYLGTVTTVSYAQRDDSAHYIVDRIAATTTHEIVNDGSPSVTALHTAVREGRATLKTSAQTFTYYDGPAFDGLPLGRLGDFGAPVRTETLVLTDEIVRDAFRNDIPDADGVPPYLRPDGPPAWTDDYPDGFRQQMPALAGYTFSPGGAGRTRGWFVQQMRHRYDFQTGNSSARRGLLVGVRDPMGRDSRVTYDGFGLLAVRSTDAVGLSTEAEPDYRVLAPRRITDANGNWAACAFTPLGLLERVAALGKAGEPVGDTLGKPGIRYVYDLGGAGQPMSVRTIRRVWHSQDPATPPSGRDDTIETVEYSDGFGRLLQKRARAEDVIIGHPALGGSALPADQDDPATQADVRGARNGDPARPNVAVSGWQIYDNKGRVVERHDPFFSTGWTFAPPTEVQLGQRVRLFYDPRGQLLRSVYPDGSEDRVVHGSPSQLTEPDTFRPSPWETYAYDPNDNAQRTAAPGATAYQHHWNTPSSVVADALGRPVTVVRRTRAPGATAVEEVRTKHRYDIRGNLLQVTDALGRTAFEHVYDLAGRQLRTRSIDAGTQQPVYDAAGREIERRDSRGSLLLQTYDRLGRPVHLWARDRKAEPVTQRERREYGDGGRPDQPPGERAAARAANRLGAVHRHFDEAGVVTVEAYDFKGNALERTRQTVTDAAILAVFPDPARTGEPPNWQVSPFRIDWEPPAGTSLAQHAAALLDPTVYATTTRFDGLNRIVTLRTPAGTGGERQEVQLSYNRSGSLEQVDLDGETIVDRIAYDANGQRILTALGNGVMTRYAYDPRTRWMVRLRSEAYLKAAGDGLTYRPSGAPLQDLAHRYDLVGNSLEIVDRTPGSGFRANPTAGSLRDKNLRTLVARGDALVRQFSYDPLYRLVSATGREGAGAQPSDLWVDRSRPGFGAARAGTPDPTNAASVSATYQESFTYDPAGNLTRLVHAGSTTTEARTYQLAGGTNRLQRLAMGQRRIDFAYDAAGNLLQETTSRRYEWDHRNQMKAFRTQAGDSEPSVHAHYLYAPGGERVKKLVRKQGGSVETTTYIDGIFEHHRWSGPNGNEGANTLVHLKDGQRRILQQRQGPAHPDEGGPDVQYVLGDQVDSCSVVVDGTGAFVNREEFTPYGETTFGSFGRKRYRYTGRERDEESGLNHHGRRYYAPWLGRWSSTDPAGPVDAWNLYIFGQLNPLRFVDPEGTNAKDKAMRQMHAAVDAEQAATKNVNDLRHKISNGFGKLEKIQKEYDKLLESEPAASSAKAIKAFEREAERLSLLAEMVGEDISHADELLPGAQRSLLKASDKLLDAKNAMVHAGFQFEEIQHGINERKKLGGRGSFGPLGGGGGAAGAAKAGAGGKLLKGAHVLGKVMKITTIAEAGIAGAKTVNHLFHGDFDEAFDEVKSFAYDQTIGTAEAIVDLGRSAAGAIGDAVFGPSEPSAATVRRQNLAKERAVCYEIGADIVGTHLSGSLQAQQSQGRSLGEMVTLSGRSWTGANQVFNRYCRPLFSTR